MGSGMQIWVWLWEGEVPLLWGTGYPAAPHRLSHHLWHQAKASALSLVRPRAPHSAQTAARGGLAEPSDTVPTNLHPRLYS